MEYVEILRARRILTWYTGILIVGLVVEAISFYASHGHNHNEGTMPFSMLVGGASFGALIIASLVVSGLSAEAANTTPLIWTRPLPRATIALRFIAVDAAAIVIGYAITIAAMLLGIAIIGGLPGIEFDGVAILRDVLLGLGGALMWYAVVSAAASRLPGRGPLLAGLSWGVFPILIGLVYVQYFPIWLHDLVYVLAMLDPLSWLGGMTPQGNASIIPLTMWQRTLGESTIALVVLVASVRLWSTREA